jgi:two-component system LytT family response regulator
MAPVGEASAPIRVLVVDDEPLARRNLVVLLRRDPDIGPIAECGSGIEAIDVVRETKPDLVFLDVQMPECDGFDVLEMLGADMPRTVIFVTAHDAYALQAFEAGALDYLLKPFDDARFDRALARAKDNLARYSPRDPRPVRRLAVRSPGKLLFLDVPDIDWVEAASYYACIHIGRQTHVLRRSLTELERDLGEERFIRLHRSAIVNIDRIRGLEMQSGGDYQVVLETGVRLPLSRRYRKRLQQRLGATAEGG